VNKDGTTWGQEIPRGAIIFYLNFVCTLVYDMQGFKGKFRDKKGQLIGV
jgi:hypothetical protein